VTDRRRLGRNVAVLAAAEALSRGLTFLVFTQLARVLTPSDYGRVEVAMAAMIFLTLAVDLGLGLVGTRDIAGGGTEVAALIRRVVSTQLLVALAVNGALAFVVLGLPIDPTLGRLLLVLGLSLFGYPFLLSWVLQGRHRMTPVAALQVLRQAVFALAAVMLVRAPDGLLRLPWAEVLAVTAAAVGYIVLLGWTGDPVSVAQRGVGDRSLLREALPIGGSQLVWAGRLYLPIMLLAACTSEAGIGFFGAAHRIVMVGQTLLGVYFTALFPMMSEAVFRSSDALVALLRRSVRRVLWPMVAVAVATTLAAPSVMRLVFGGQFVRPEASATLAVLVWVLPILAWRRHDRNALIALGHEREELACSLFGLALLVPLTPYLGARYGVVGGAWAMVLAELGGATVTWWRLKRHLPSVRLLHHALGARPAR
jgi:O-antigen/teichoic acid export membrane protein